MMGKEIERKFLIHDLTPVLRMAWDNSKYANYDICQAYIRSGVRVRVQVRRPPHEREVHYYLTVKTKRKGIERKEFTFEITEEEGKNLLDEFKDTSVKKSRHIFEYKGKIWEIDVFREDNRGLFIAEIELEDKDEEYEIPPGICEEVTDDERYYNSNLAKNPYRNWSKENE